MVTERGHFSDEGYERGCAGEAAPSTPAFLALPGPEPHAEAEALRIVIAGSIPLPAHEVAIQVATAEVIDTFGAHAGSARCSCRREIAFTRVLLGADPELPRWSRTFVGRPARTTGVGAPPWIAALGREVRTWTARRVEPPPAGAPVVLDVFAAADLVRAVAVGWLDGGVGAGQVALPPVLEMDDPGFAFAPLSGSDDVDAEGTRCRPLVVVREGRLVGTPAAPAGEPTGSAVASSWRGRPMPGWRSLVVRALVTVAFPDDVPVITRVMLIEGQALVAGLHPDGSCFGPVPTGSPERWLGTVVAGCGPAIVDGNGVPLTTPPLLARRMAP